MTSARTARRPPGSRERTGDVISPVIMWLGVLLALVIAGAWFMGRLRPVSQDFETVTADLRAIREAAGRACSSVAYLYRYNPHTEEGTIRINGSSACINLSGTGQCTQLPCAFENVLFDTRSNSTDVSLASFAELVIEKQDSLLIYLDRTYPGDVQPPLLSSLRIRPARGNCSSTYSVDATLFDASGISWTTIGISNGTRVVARTNLTGALQRYELSFSADNCLFGEANYSVSVSAADTRGNIASWPDNATFEVTDAP
jgi:hypothetical protein